MRLADVIPLQQPPAFKAHDFLHQPPVSRLGPKNGNIHNLPEQVHAVLFSVVSFRTNAGETSTAVSRCEHSILGRKSGCKRVDLCLVALMPVLLHPAWLFSTVT